MSECECAAVFFSPLSLLWHRFVQHPKNFGFVASFLERKVGFLFCDFEYGGLLSHPGCPWMFISGCLNWSTVTALLTQITPPHPQTEFFHCIMVFSFQIQAQVMQLYLYFLSLQCVSDCVLYYYLTKKSQNYKTLVRRNFGNRRRRNQVFIYFLFTYALFSHSKHRYDSKLCCTFWESVLSRCSLDTEDLCTVYILYTAGIV